MAAIDATSRLTVFWEAPSQLAQGALDYIFAGSAFSSEVIDTSVDRYEVELYNTVLNIYETQGYFYTPQADLTLGDAASGKVRIRAILRDGTKTNWATSGTLILSMFATTFADSDNAVFLSFV
jgi:hypothetical protein